MKQMRIRPLFITGLLFVCGLLVAGSADAAKKKDLTPAPDWHAMTRGEHIAWLTLTPEAKPLVREAMQKRIASLLKIFPAQVTTLRDSVVACVTVPASRLFLPNGAELSGKGKELLEKLPTLFPGDDFRFIVSAHTANAGSATYITQLSQQRADAVAALLKQRLGATSIVVPYGVGAAEPIARNNTYQGREENRRVEIWLIPSASWVEKLTAKQ